MRDVLFNFDVCETNLRFLGPPSFPIGEQVLEQLPHTVRGMGVSLLGGHQPIVFGEGLEQGKRHRLTNLAGFIVVVRACISPCPSRSVSWAFRQKQRVVLRLMSRFFPCEAMLFIPFVRLLESQQTNRHTPGVVAYP